jgi:colanic acid/amylovoran biosynthesis protein
MFLIIGLFWAIAVGKRYGFDVLPLLPDKRLFRIYKDFTWADLIVGMGGGFYNDNYYQSLPGRLFHLQLGKILGKPVAISAHSIGPFRHWFYRWLAQSVFCRLDLICLRDEESLAHLDFTRIDRTKVKVVTDSAWLLEPASEHRAREILRSEGVPGTRMLVSLALVRWKFYQTVSSEEGHHAYIAAVAATVTRLISEKDCHIVFLSTNTNLGGHPTDDRLVADEVLKLLPAELIDRTTVVRGEYQPQELQAIYGLVDFHIGTRLHSNILATSMTTPVIGIAYEFKMVGAMKTLNLADYVTDIETVTPDGFWNQVSAAVDNRHDIRAKIIERLPQVRADAQHNAHYIAMLLQPAPPDETHA